MRTRLLTAPLIAGFLLVPASAAHATDGPGGWVDVDDDGSEIDVGARDGVDDPGSDPPPSECTWSSVPESEVASVWWTSGEDVDLGEAVDPAEYDWWWMSCPDGNGGITSDLIPVPRAEPVDPTDLRDEALDTLSLPSPAIEMNPRGDQVVHVETWLWIDDADWRDHRKSVTAGGVTTTVLASPRRAIWELGNGDTVVCGGPGTPYDPSIPSDEQATDCSYTYTHTSAGQPGDAYQATATIEWTVSWTVTGAPGGGPLPALFTSSPVTVRVSEMQALNQ